MHMKKKFLLVSLLALLALSLVALTGCGADDEKAIREVITADFDAIDPENEDLVKQIESQAGSDLDTLGISTDEFCKSFLGGFEYEIGDVEVDGDTATAEVTFKVKSLSTLEDDFATKWTAMITEQADELSSLTTNELYERAGKLFMEILDGIDPKEKTVTIDLEKNSDGEWEENETADDVVSAAMME